MYQFAGAEVERGGEVAALVLAGRDDFQALPAWRPLCAHFGQQVKFQLIGKHQCLLRTQAFPTQADVSQ